MAQERFAITMGIWSLSDGVAWRIEGNGPDFPHAKTFYGSQRTITSRGLDGAAVYDALHSSIRELVLEGKLPWLF